MLRRLSILAALALLLGQGAPNAQDAEAWDEKYYNPKPLDDDFVLPMPCSGYMVFRRIEVPSEGALGDRKIVVGGNDERFRFVENSRYEYISGSFTDPENEASRWFYLGKYEITEMQYDALLGDDCPKTSRRTQRPAVEVSWFDAVKFAHDFTSWLHENALEDMPREGEQLGFLRLPTETEWEFAARGGAAVSDAVFQEAVFPMAEALHSYVWFNSSKSASKGKVQPAGLLEANPLGLHDMLGNAAEIILEPFRLNKLSRLHGQAGGFVVKGGSAFSSEAEIRSSYRQEYPHFRENGPVRTSLNGFRVALTAPVISSAERQQSYEKAWAELSTSAAVTDRTAPLEDPVAELALIAEGTDDPDLKRRLANLERIVATNIASRNEQQARSAKATLRLGAFLGQKLKGDVARIAAVQDILEGRIAAGSSEAVITKTRQSLEASESALQENLDYYIDTAIQLAEDHSEEIIDGQVVTLTLDFEQRDLSSLTPHVQTFVTQVGDYRQSGDVDRERWLDAIAANGG
jgi:hypothetical protein